jgi:hypothetical protein
VTPRQQRRATRKEEYAAKHKLAHLPIDSHGQVITPGYGRYKTSHDGSLYIPGVLQMIKWAKRPNDGPYKARGGKVKVIVPPMV